MPRDVWAKSRSRDSARKQANLHRGRSKPNKKALHASEQRLRNTNPADIILWFGKHKGQTLSQVPRSYLQFLSSIARDNTQQPGPFDFRFQILQEAASNLINHHHDYPKQSPPNRANVAARPATAASNVMTGKMAEQRDRSVDPAECGDAPTRGRGRILPIREKSGPE